MTLKEALVKYHNFEIELLLAHVLGKPKEFVFLHPEYKLSNYQVLKLSSMVRRRQKGEPIAYILGYKDFMGLRFKVNKSVLIPRPETEWILEHLSHGVIPALWEESLQGKKKILRPAFLKPKKGETQNDACIVRILDVGTGSGCIAVAIAHQCKVKSVKYKVQITASDISPAALKIAKENARRHKTSVKFVLSDLLQNIKGKVHDRRIPSYTS